MGDTYTLQEWHKKQAADAFNQTWDLIDKPDRSKDEELLMIHKAHASRYHWGEAGGPEQLATGEWQISRVYALVNHPQSALYHGEASLACCESAGLPPFDFAFACEAIARACHLLGDGAKRDQFIEKGKAFAEKIVKDEDRSYYLSELNSIVK